MSRRAHLPVFPVKGIYVNAHVAKSPRMERLIRLVDETELNAVVLDVNSGLPGMSLTDGRGNLHSAHSASAQGVKRLVRKLKHRNIYVIARVVTFKNPSLAMAHPDLAMHRKNGTVWTDAKGAAWIDPYRERAWDYPIRAAVEAARMGVDEVQFDYVRFPENAAQVSREVAFLNPCGWSREEAVRRFLHAGAKRVHRAGALVSADVFGLVGSTSRDMGIGQSWRMIASEVDVISPMIYPSHYSAGIWGIRQPDLQPSAVISHALKDALHQNRKLTARGLPAAQVRPWLQSFTATWVQPHQRYASAEIREQVQAASRLGVTSYLLWNASSRYPLG